MHVSSMWGRVLHQIKEVVCKATTIVYNCLTSASRHFYRILGDGTYLGHPCLGRPCSRFGRRLGKNKKKQYRLKTLAGFYVPNYSYQTIFLSRSRQNESDASVARADSDVRVLCFVVDDNVVAHDESGKILGG